MTDINDSDFFCKYIMEIRTGNPSLAVKILNATPRPILRERDRLREVEVEVERKSEIER